MLNAIKRSSVLILVAVVAGVAFATVRLMPYAYDAGGLALMLVYLILGASLAIGIMIITLRIARSLVARN